MSICSIALSRDVCDILRIEMIWLQYELAYHKVQRLCKSADSQIYLAKFLGASVGGPSAVTYAFKHLISTMF